MATKLSEKIRQFKQMYNRTHSPKEKQDLSSPTYKKIRYDFILDNSGEKLLSSGSKWIEIHHVGTQTTSRDVDHETRLRIRKRETTSAERVTSKRTEPEQQQLMQIKNNNKKKGSGEKEKASGKAKKSNVKSASHSLRGDHKKRTKRTKVSDAATANRIPTASSRTADPGSAKRVRKRRSKRPGKGTGSRDPNRSNRTGDSSSRKRSVKTLFRSPFTETCQSETTFPDVSMLSEIGRSMVVDGSLIASTGPMMAALTAAKTKEGSKEVTQCSTQKDGTSAGDETTDKNRKNKKKIAFENKREDTPASPSGAGDSVDAQRQCDSPYQCCLDGDTDFYSITTTSSITRDSCSCWTRGSLQDIISPKSSLLTFSGEVLRKRYSNPRLVLHALNPSGDRPKWPFSNCKRSAATQVLRCKACDDMVFLFDSQHCDGALASWGKSKRKTTGQDKYRRIQRKGEVNSTGMTPKSPLSPLRTTINPSVTSINQQSKPLSAARDISIVDFGTCLTTPPSERHCSFLEFLNGGGGGGISSSASHGKMISGRNTVSSVGTWTSRERCCGVKSSSSRCALCVGHNTCLDLTQGLLPARDSKRDPQNRQNERVVQRGGHRNDEECGLALQGESVWKSRRRDASWRREGRIRSRGRGDDDDDDDNAPPYRKRVGVNGKVCRETKTWSRGGQEVRTASATADATHGSATRTSRGGTSGLQDASGVETWCSARSGMWEIGEEVAHFAGNTIVISRAATGDAEERGFASKTEPLLLGHFRNGIKRKNMLKGQKGICSAGPSLTQPEEPRKIDVDTDIGSSSIGERTD